VKQLNPSFQSIRDKCKNRNNIEEVQDLQIHLKVKGKVVPVLK
jgi:hypothetical protein